MRSSSHFIPAARVGTASPYRMDAFAPGAGATKAGVADPAQLALQAAFARGAETGRQEALAQAAGDRVRLAALLEGHDRELGRLNEDLARAVLALAVDLAMHVTRAQIALREDAVLPVIADALAMIRDDASPARLFVNPDDARLVQQDLGPELAQRGCMLVPEPGLAHGECRLEGTNAEIDGALAARWRRALLPLGESVDWIA